MAEKKVSFSVGEHWMKEFDRTYKEIKKHYSAVLETINFRRKSYADSLRMHRPDLAVYEDEENKRLKPEVGKNFSESDLWQAFALYGLRCYITDLNDALEYVHILLSEMNQNEHHKS